VQVVAGRLVEVPDVALTASAHGWAEQGRREGILHGLPDRQLTRRPAHYVAARSPLAAAIALKDCLTRRVLPNFAKSDILSK